MPDPPEPAALASLSPDDPILKSLLAGRRPVTRELRKGFKKVIKEVRVARSERRATTPHKHLLNNFLRMQHTSSFATHFARHRF